MGDDGGDSRIVSPVGASLQCGESADVYQCGSMKTSQGLHLEVVGRPSPSRRNRRVAILALWLRGIGQNADRGNYSISQPPHTRDTVGNLDGEMAVEE